MTATFDDLVVRGTMSIYELLIQQIRATNGSVLVSSAAKLASASLVSGVSYTCIVEGAGSDYQPFVVGDVLRAQRINIGATSVVWKSDLVVTAINTGGNQRAFTANLIGASTPPAKGMEFVRLGNTSDVARQGAVYITADDSGAPFIDVVNGIAAHADWNTAGKVKVRLGRLDGVTGNANEYGLWAGNTSSSILASTAGVTVNNVPLRFQAGSSTVVMEMAPGNSAPYLALGSPLPTGPMSENGIWAGLSEATTNLFTNPSFETNTTGLATYNTGTPTGTRARSTDFAKFGAYSYKIDKTGGATQSDRYGVYNSVNVVSGQTYTFSVWVKVSAISGGLERVWIQASTNVTTALAYIYGVSDWQRVVITTTATGTGSALFYVAADNCDTATIYVDGFQCENRATATEYCDGSLGADYAWTGTAHASTSTRNGGYKLRVGEVSGGTLVKGLYWNGTDLIWKATNTSLDASGNLTATNATLTGTITADLGAIGGWTIASTGLTATNIGLYSGAANTARLQVGTGSNVAGVNSVAAGTDIAFWAGDTHANRTAAEFRVRADGQLYATGATLSGAITATSGTITGDFSVTGGGKLTAGDGEVVFDVNGQAIGLHPDINGGVIPAGVAKSISWYDTPSTRTGLQARQYVGKASDLTPHWNVTVNPDGSSPLTMTLWYGGATLNALWFTNLAQVSGLPGLFLAKGTPNTAQIPNGARLQLNIGSEFSAAAHLKAATTNTYDLGEAGVKWRKLYVGEVIADTVSGGTALGGNTWQRADAGDMYIYSFSEANNRTLYVANPGAGTMSLDVEGNITLGGSITVGGNVDGVDLSAFKTAYDGHNHDGRYYTETELQTSGSASVHWGNVTNKPATFAPAAHALVGSDHTASGLSAGHVVRASGPTTFAWAQLAHSDLSGVGTNTHTQIDSHIAATAAHGVSGAIVGTTDSQTLSNKTLTTPTIASFANAQHAHTNAASGGTIAHGSLTGIGANDHHSQAHVLASTSGLGADHTVAGLTARQVLRATGATTAAFGAIEDADLPSTIVRTSRQIIAGNGLTGGGALSADVTVTMGTPGTLTASTTNAVTSTSHTHAITTSSDPQVSATILQTNASGVLTLQALAIRDGIYTNASAPRRYYEVVAYNSNGNPDTGTLKIALPKYRSTTMMAIRIVGFQYSAGTYGRGAWEALIAGYNYSTGWIPTGGSAVVTGEAPFSSVRLCDDGANDIILLGDTDSRWYYPKIVVSYMIAGWSNTTGWESGWSMSVISDETGITTKYTPPVYHAPPDYRTLTAGNGLEGGGDFTANRTLTLGTPSSLTATTTNAVTSASHTHSITTGAAATLSVSTTNTEGSGAAIARADHTHAITSSSNPGAAASILASTAAGALTLVDLTVTALTATRLVASDASDKLVSTSLASWMTGTANRVTVADDGDGTVTLSAPQDIHTTATPTFGGLITPWLRPAADSTTAIQLRTSGGTAILTVDTTNSRIGIGNTPAYKLDVSGDVRLTGTLYADGGIVDFGTNYFQEGALFELKGAKAFNLNQTIQASGWSMSAGGALVSASSLSAASMALTGAATIAGNLTVGGTVLQVSAAGTRVGINRAADQQFDLDVAGAIRGQYLVGPHALQLSDAKAIVHFDGPAPYNRDFSGTSNTHMGENATETGGVIYRPGKFGKAVQLAEATTNLVANPSFEADAIGATTFTGWNLWGSPPTREITAGGLYGEKCLRLITNGTNQGVLMGLTVTSGTTYTISFYVYVITGRPAIYMTGTGVSAFGAELPSGWTGNNLWNRYSYTFTATANGTCNICLGRSGGGVNGEYLLDAVQFEQKAYATPYCLDPDSLVCTRDGIKKLGDVQVGEELYGKSGYNRVDAKWDVETDAFEITLRNGAKVIASGDHRFMATKWPWDYNDKSGWKYRPVSELIVGDYLQLNTEASATEQATEPDVAYLMGYLLGDGYLCKENSRGQAESSWCFGKDFKSLGDLVRERYVRCMPKSKYNEYPSVLASSDNEWVLRTNNRDVAQVFIDRGFPYGTGANGKYMPEAAWLYERGDLLEFLAGYIDSDGTVDSNGNLAVASSSKQLIAEMQSLIAMRLGVNGHITHDTSYSGYGEKDNYVLRFKIVDAIRLREMGLRLLHTEKSRRLNALALGTGKFTEKHRRFEKIVSIVPLGMRKLIDITLAPNHDFIANGIVTHNCDGSLGAGHSWSGTAHASTSSRTATKLEYPIRLVNPQAGTIMMWVLADGFNSAGGGLWGWGSVNGTMDAYFNSVGTLVGRVGGSPVSSVSGFLTGIWRHLAWTWDAAANKYRVFLDGVQQGSDQAYSAQAVHATSLAVGGIAALSSSYTHNGLIDEFVLLDYAADAKLIRSIYESNAPVFAESSVVSFRAPTKSQIWVDEFGFWAKGQSGGEAFGIFGGDPRRLTTTKSWGGVTMEENDIVIGRTSAPSYTALHWDDSAGELILGRQAAEHLSLVSGAVRIKNATTVYADLTGSTFILGNASEENLRLTTSGIEFRNATEVQGSLSGTSWTLGKTGASENNIVITPTSISLNRGGVAHATLTGTDFQLGTVENIRVTPTVVEFRNSSTVIGSLDGTTLTLGQTSGNHVVITATSLDIKYGSTPKISLNSSGDASFTGSINATGGTVGGWTLGESSLTGGSATLSSTGKLTLGTGNNVLIADAGDANYRLYIGHATPASAPFSVTKTGGLTSSLGLIGGWTITSDRFQGGADARLYSTGKMALGSIYGMVVIDPNHADWRIWSGVAADIESNPLSSQFRVSKQGQLTASGATIYGHIVANSGDIAGVLTVGAGGRISSGATAWGTGDGFWFEHNSGNPRVRIGTAAGNRLLFETTTGILTIVGNGSGITSISGSNITTGTLSADRIGAGSITADKINVATLSALTADMGTLTAGSIVIGSTNKIWLNDSADGALALGGNVKGSAPFQVSNTGVLTATGATVTGTIQATAGYIGNTDGWNIGAGEITSVSSGATAMRLSALGASPFLALGATAAPGLWMGDGLWMGQEEATTNLVTNPSFETNTTGWTNYTSGSPTGTRTRVTTHALAGTYSYELVKTGGGTTDRWGAYRGVSVVSGQTYTFSAWIKVTAITGGNQAVRIYCQNNITATSAFLYGTGDWRRVSLTATATGTGTANFYIWIDDCTTATIYIDAVQVENKAYATPYVDGSMATGTWAGTAHASASSRTAATRARMGTVANNALTAGWAWDGSALNVVGSITATGGSITGAMSIGSTLTMGTGGVIKSGATAYNSGTGYWLEHNGGTPRMFLGNSAGNKLLWTGSALELTGSITATSGDISGVLTIGASGGIYQGTGTFASPTTGLKIWNDSSAGYIGRIGGYNAGALQWYAGTDGKLYAGNGVAIMDANGFTVEASSSYAATRGYRLATVAGVNLGGVYSQNNTLSKETFISLFANTLDGYTPINTDAASKSTASVVSVARSTSNTLLKATGNTAAAAKTSSIDLVGGSAGARIDLDTGTLNLTNVAGEISVNVTGFMDVSNALRSLSLRVDGDAPGGGIAGTISFTNVTVAAASGVYGYVEMNGATGRANTGWMKIYVGTEVRYIPYWTQIG